MITLNLETKSNTQKRLKVFLEQNASEILADKINNGVYIEKDGIRLLNKKNLDGFVKYATEQAKKQAAKGETGAFLEDDTVFGWAIHYFEENSIEGQLYNEDGTEYKIATKAKSAVTPVKAEPQSPKPTQATLFDMLNTTSENVKSDNEDDEDDGEELNNDYTPEELQELADEAEESETAEQTNTYKPIEETDKPIDILETTKISPLYEHYLAIQKQYSDSVVFLRLSDFYEAFGNKAIAVAEPLNLTITGRDFGLKERVPMIGIPYHAFDNYLTKLIRAGYKIAVAEDINDVTVFPQYDNEEPEELSEEEMRAFDSYVDEDSDELLTISKIVGPIDDDEFDESCTEIINAETAKAFEQDALCILYNLFDNEITLA